MTESRMAAIEHSTHQDSAWSTALGSPAPGFSYSAIPYTSQPRFLSRVIAVASGKGGVGKTNVAVNLGLALARRGLKVALLDADLGTANVDVLMGIQPRYHLHHVVTGQKTLAEIVVQGPYGLKIVPGASGLPDLANLPNVQRQALLRALMVLDGTVDLLLIDTNAGIGDNVIQFILAAGELLLVTTPEPTAITDAYALIKMLSNYPDQIVTGMVVNNVHRRGEGEATAHKLMTVTQQFLGRQLQFWGTLPFDQSVIEAIKMQSPLVQSHPNSPASKAINALSERLWSEAPSPAKAVGVGQFLQQLLATSVTDITS